MLTPREIAEEAVKALNAKQAKDVTLLRTSDVTVLADYFVICTATSSTHVKTLTDEVDKVLSEQGEPPLRREGYRGGGWIPSFSVLTLLGDTKHRLSLFKSSVTNTGLPSREDTSRNDVVGISTVSYTHLLNRHALRGWTRLWPTLSTKVVKKPE